MTSPTVADLTVAEFRELIHDTVSQSLAELLADPDQGRVLRDDVAEELGRSIKEVQAAGKTIPLSDLLKDFGLSE